MKKLIIFVVIVLVAVWAVYSCMHRTPKGEHTTTQAPSVQTVTFTDPSTKQSVSVAFDATNDTATLNGLVYNNVVLKHAVSADGARYTNDEGLEVWSQGEAVTVSKSGKVLFSGNVGGQTPADRLTSSTWVWQATTEEDTVTEPKNPPAFTIAFDTKEGTMHATTDCNAIFGNYTVGSDNALTFGALGMTKKFCQDSQEDIFAKGLNQVASFDFTGSGSLMLQLKDSGTMLFAKQ